MTGGWSTYVTDANGDRIDEHPLNSDDRSAGTEYPLHVVRVTPKRIECALHCVGPDPHIGEYRAQDVNPNR